MVLKPNRQDIAESNRQTLGGGNAFAALAALPPNTDKRTLMQAIDRAVTEVLSELANHDAGELSAETLIKVQTALTFLERCLAFKDDEFTGFSRKRANELQMALANTIERSKRSNVIPCAPKEPVAKESASAQAPTPQPVPTPAPPAPSSGAAEKTAETFDPKAFLYEREEKILIEYAYERICKRLSFLRGDKVVVEKGKQVLTSGIHEDGVAPFFLLSPRFPEILRQPFCDLIKEKRDLLSRRVYVHTNKNDSDEEVRRLFTEERHRDIDGIIGLAFDDWAGEIARAGIAGLPQERSSIGPKKKEESSAGIGSSLKKVFSFGKKEKEVTKTNKIVVREDHNPIRIHKEWQKLENKGVFSLSQHFSFALLSYALQLSEKQFETEYECIRQIVDQQETPDVGPVVSNLSRLYKFYDNIFFDLVILVLFHRKNKFDINMLQAACMSQNFVVDRLPLTMDELRRRPMEHAKHIMTCLESDPIDKDVLRQALVDYFYVHETIHASKVGKRISASENLLKRQGEKMNGAAKQVIEEIRNILSDIANLKKQQEEDGIFLGEEIQTAIDEGIARAMMHFR